jgi:hypothetical protein
LPEEKREILRRLHDPDAVLAGKKVIIVTTTFETSSQ